MSPKQDEAPENVVESVHARLFKNDVLLIKQMAKKNGLKWHTELRLLVRRALRSIAIIKEK